MPTITAQTIISRAQTILQDTTGIRWPTAELLNWLNDGQREIVLMRPDGYTKLANVACVAGTRQQLASDGIMVIEVLRNMGAGGATPGRAIRKVPRQILDGQVPDWHSTTASATIQHYVTEQRAPKHFWVYPPATAGTNVEVLYSANPPDVAAVGNVITLDDIYANPLIDYVLYRAYCKDAETIGNAERATLARASFEKTLGLKAAADAGNTATTNVQG